MTRCRAPSQLVLSITCLGALVLARPATAAAPTRRNVEIEFEAVDGATGYEVRVSRKDQGGTPLTFRLKRPRWVAHVKAGLYLMQLRTLDDRGVPGAWSPPSELNVKLAAVLTTAPAAQSVLRATNGDEERVTFAWEPLPGARRYRVEVRAGEWTTSRETEGPSLAIDLPVARAYAWTVVGVDERGQDGEAAPESSAFTLTGPALAAPRLARPLSRYVARIDWDEVPHAARFETELHVYNPATRAWTQVPGPSEVTAPGYALDVRRPAGRYRLRVRATGAHRAASPQSELTFTAAGGFRDEGAMADARLRASLGAPTRFTAFAGYQLSPLDYTAAYAEANSLARVSSVAGGVRAGVTWRSRRTRWGAVLSADAGGLSLANRSFAYGAVDARARYRLSPGRRDQLTIEAGAFVKRLPVVKGSPVDGFDGVTEVEVLGPVIGAAYAYPLSERWSLQGEARVYPGAAGGDATLSHEVGAYARYRRTPRLTFTGGVANRRDEARFKAAQGAESFARPGTQNRVEVKAVTLTLTLETSF